MQPDCFKIIYDFRAPRTASLREVLRWRKWSGRELGLIRSVYRGVARRFSTSHDGQFCDVVLNRENSHAD